ncbi:integrating conjugative element protein [Vibrio zhanjiangensis]|uniref:Integrating conjugative element protein n=1 Tax=Vibrio zhanjiangensis TaxID=1046128 RepID=A0ABQ6F276_9VIBR|nr:TIGR03759 family integrating conjugative element protein [Vibrio zhanjiangensis]GLT19582.1 integrating conjugative element protein [Vibrio zhanjiangensis]
MIKRVGLLLLVAFASTASDIQTTREVPQGIDTLSQATQWGLTESDWARYQALLQSPQGFGMSMSNPLVVLGRFARNDEERHRYAEQLMRFEQSRTEGLLAFNRAYQAAWKKSNPNLTPIGHTRPGRIALFVRRDCAACDQAFTHWRSQGVGVDVFMTDSLGNDLALKQWASEVGVRKREVSQKEVTLNHDTQGLAFTLARGTPLPVAATRRGGQWSVIESP